MAELLELTTVDFVGEPGPAVIVTTSPRSVRPRGIAVGPVCCPAQTVSCE